MRQAAVAAAVCLAGLALLVRASSASAASSVDQRAATGLLLAQLSREYTTAFPSHNPLAARDVRGLAAAAATLARQDGDPAALAAAQRLRRQLAATTFKLQIWPLPDQIRKLVATIRRDMRHGPLQSSTPGGARALAAGLVAAATAQATRHDPASAAADLAEAYAVFAHGEAPRLDAIAPELTTRTEIDIWAAYQATGGADPAEAVPHATADVDSDLHDDAAVLGEITVSRGTIITDAAIILFREGLEAVLILAAITASFTGDRRRLRRPVLVGALLGLAATVVTYLLAQAILDELGDSGLRLQAITGLLAIAVLLVVTNWFFHRVYWSDWIGRFNRRRKTLEQAERLGIISAQTLGFVILGLTSVYREGFETVLFLQNLQVSAGTRTTLTGVAIGLGATLVVGFLTFALGRKLPYRRMLILTGILIGLVLAIMVGITVNTLQELAWLPATPTGFSIDSRVSQWTGIFPTWEGITAQITALLIVYGSYAAARQLQHHRRHRILTAQAVAPDYAATGIDARAARTSSAGPMHPHGLGQGRREDVRDAVDADGV
jgi:FTR1 family protein